MKVDITPQKKKAVVAQWRKWAAALESGKYKQGKGHLKFKSKKDKTIRYCCLGCVCEINGLKGILDKEYNFFTISNERVNDFLPTCQQEKLMILEDGEFSQLGMKEFNKMLKKNDHYRSLVFANDNGVKFSTIAKFLYRAADILEETGESCFNY